MLAAILLAACAAPALPPTATPVPTLPPTPATLTAEGIAMDEYLSGPAEEGDFAGAVMVVRDGQVLLEQAYGMADQAKALPNTPQTRFWLHSISKTFTAVGILILQEQGKLNVQDSVCKYVTECPAHWQSVTLHHLLTHSSGLGVCDCPTDFYPADHSVLLTPVAPAAIVDFYRDAAMEFEPGATYRYGAGYYLLGYVIEQASGQRYIDFLRQHIFEPLGMANSGYDDNYESVAVGYTEGQRPVPVEYEDISWSFSSGGLYSTGEDLYRFDQALYTDALLPATAREAMFTGHVRIQAELGVAAGYGMVRGMHTYLNNETVIWKDGCCFGGSTFLGRFVEEGVTIIILTNRNYDWRLGALNLALGLANMVVAP